MEFQTITPVKQLCSSQKKMFYGFFGAFLVVVIFLGVVGLESRATHLSDTESIMVSIPSGASVMGTALDLKEQGIIRSSRLCALFVTMQKKNVIAGDYQFDTNENLFTIIERITTGDFGDVYVRALVPEGATRVQMADIFEKYFPAFDRDTFLTLTKGKEGFLFPDTYFLLPSSTAEEIVMQMEKLFQKKITSLQDTITASGHTLEEIIIMASLIQKEATHNIEEQKIISGILWKRIEIGMALQVDAPFLYERNQGSADLSTSDLEQDSPYNTYTNLGLPPTPIGSPGIDAIQAAIEPTSSSYLFYLHGKDGVVHYARNFDEHRYNKQTYLR